MTPNPDDSFWDKHPDGVDQPEPDSEQGPDGDDAFDEDAAWREIIENYGDRPEMGAELDSPVAPPVEPSPSVEAGLFDRAFLDASTAAEAQAAWEDEGHFVPPEPPPLPPLDPRRKIAWGGLFGGPLLLLLAVIFGWAYPTWLIGLLFAGFVGGFVYLVATMPRTRHDDWSGDDGAVV